MTTIQSSPPSITAPQLDLGGVTVRGAQRDKNEDQFLIANWEPALRVVRSSVAELREGGATRASAAVLAVADGIGGQTGGDYASRAVVHALERCLRDAAAPPAQPAEARNSIPGVRDGLERAFAMGKASIERMARTAEGFDHMGTTLTVAYLAPPYLYVAHIGDSRCHLLHDGMLFQLTRDHTVAEELHRAWGAPLGEDTPFRNMLSRALSAEAAIDHRPDIMRWQLIPGDVVLVCSDGVSGALDEQTMAGVLLQEPNAQSAAAELALSARAAGAGDDVTAAVARVIASN